MSAMQPRLSDEEKSLPNEDTKMGGHIPKDTVAQVIDANDGVNRDTGVFAKLWAAARWLDSFGVEVRGIERVPEEARDHGNIRDSMWLWMSANMTISTFSLGTLSASIWYMSLTDAALTIVFFNLLCTIPVAIFSTWGKNTGLRQMVLGRYSYGMIGTYFPILLNCIACLGWSIINTIVGASALRAVSPSDHHQLPTAAGVVIIAVITLVVSLFGYKVVHHFERWASVPVFIIFVIMLGEGGKYMTSAPMASGPVEAANVLSFGGTVAGFALGWTSLAADYTVNFPADSSSTKVFIYTYIGLNVPLIFVEVLGAAMMTTFTAKTTWGDLYTEYGLGGLLYAPLSPMGGFGRFLLVLLALSIVANNIPNMYSFALTFQAFGKYAQAVPRFFLVCVGTVIYIILAIVGASHFEEWLDTLLVILSYWLAIYSVVLCEEHWLFRGGKFSNYDLEAYNTRELMPVGYAALAATCFGVMGAVLGMAQTWYVGVIGKKIGDPEYGGDIGFELAGAFAGIVYPIFRMLERKYVGR
ncbi:hypothetical protein T439DRAFT_211182 [Meredithblackwellia eburnea MCA 4105]